jgi:hypothetical protein
MTNLGTYFYDTEGNRLASESGVLPIPLFKGMTITFHGKSGEYHVVDWSFHVGQRLEEAGLRIVLRHAGERNGQDLSRRGPYAGHESQ